MNRYLLLGVVIVVVGLPLTLLSLRDFENDADAPLDNLNRSVRGVLKKLPGVVEVDVNRILRPTHRIIHLRDRPFLSKELFISKRQHAGGQPLSADAIDREYRAYIADVDALQEEQMELLRVLIKQHGLKRIHAEGFSTQDVRAYREKIASLKDLQAIQIAKLKSQLQEVRQAIADNPSPEARNVEGKILEMLADFQSRLMEMGAAGRLLIDGEIEDVVPIEDPTAAEPAQSGDRHDAIVNNLLKSGPLSVVILDGEHDLTDSVNRLGGGKCEYIRVTTKRYREFDGE